jgi:hypothetical protein
MRIWTLGDTERLLKGAAPNKKGKKSKREIKKLVNNLLTRFVGPSTMTKDMARGGAVDIVCHDTALQRQDKWKSNGSAVD